MRKKHETLYSMLNQHENFWTVPLNRYTAHWGWKTSSRNFFSWVVFHFRPHKMDTGMNTMKLKVKLKTKDDEAVYSWRLMMPIQLKEDLTVELALMHKYGIITVQPLCKCASWNVAQRKRNRKLRLLVNLSKVNNRVSDDITNNYHPVSTLWDGGQHLEGQSLFC